MANFLSQQADKSGLWQRVENPWQEPENTTVVFALNAWRGHLYLGTRKLHNGGEVLRSADGIHWHSIAAQVDLIPVCGSLSAESVNAALPEGDKVCVLRGVEVDLRLCFHPAQKIRRRPLVAHRVRPDHPPRIHKKYQEFQCASE